MVGEKARAHSPLTIRAHSFHSWFHLLSKLTFAATVGFHLRCIAVMLHCRMTVVIPISKRGTLTLPPALRRRLALDRANAFVILEERDGELVLKPAAAVPVREIPTAVIEEWIKEDEAGLRDFHASKPAQ
jgi:bifunctional DNA-binding transcriptional regulator/antitoxin component of YhaV-PrlF toxin-antitoxin module